MYDRLRDKMNTMNYIIMSCNIIDNVSNVNSELGIPSDICTNNLTRKQEKVRSESRNILLKLFHWANLSKINEAIKID